MATVGVDGTLLRVRAAGYVLVRIEHATTTAATQRRSPRVSVVVPRLRGQALIAMREPGVLIRRPTQF